MEIKSCYVENFGVLEGENYRFSPGLNVIENENGSGKTTLAVFIKAMLYGMDDSRQRKNLSERTKYAPWQGGNYGGRLRFLRDGKEYEIIRYFGKKKSEDEFSLYDAATGKPSSDYTENIGEEIFGIDEDSFERSIFISLSAKPPAMQDSISAKLTNLIDNTDDINNFETAYERLSELSKEIKPLRAGGGEKLYDKAVREISEKEREIKDCLNSQRHACELSEKIRELSECEGELKQKYRETEEKQKKALNLRELAMYERLCRDNEEAKKVLFAIRSEFKEGYAEFENIGEALRHFKELFPFGIPSEKDEDEFSEALGKKEETEGRRTAIKPSDSEYEEYERLSGLFCTGGNRITSEDIDRNFNIYRLSEVELKSGREEEGRAGGRLSAEESKHKKIFGTGIFFLAAGVLYIFSGLFLSAFEIRGGGVFLIPALLFWAAGAALIIFSFSKKKAVLSEEAEYAAARRRTEQTEKRRGEALSFFEGFSDFSENGDIFSLYGNIKAKYERYKNLSRKAEAYSDFCFRSRGEYDRAAERIRGFREKYGLSFAGLSDRELLKRVREASNQALRLDMLCKDLEGAEEKLRLTEKELSEFSERNDLEYLKKLKEQSCEGGGLNYGEEYSPDLFQDRLKGYSEKAAELNSERKKLSEEFLKESENAEKINVLTGELEILEEKREHLSRKYELIRKAMEYLEEAKDSLSTSYMHEMRSSFEKYIKLMDDRGINFLLDSELNIKTEGKGKTWRSDYLSSGYKDLVNICVRLALTDAMYKEEKPFIILDDPFVNFDERKLSAALSFIKELSKERQLIYFVCHKSRNPEAC